MLKVSAAFLAFLVSVIVVGVVFWRWMRSEEDIETSRTLPRRRAEHEIRCPICGNVYSAIPKDGMTVCPECESYNKFGG
jgi:hypothetical protein